MKLLTLARDLRRKKSRERNSLFVAEGIRTVEEIVGSTFVITGVLVAPQLAETDRGAALLAALASRRIAVETVTAHEFSSAANTESPQGVLAIAEIPARRLTDIESGKSTRILVLDGVQDPGNVGTILRTAAALGASATFSLPGTVDLWNAKVVRSGMGAHFHHLCLCGTWEELDAFRTNRSTPVWGADRRGDPIHTLEKPGHLILVVGNEGSGLNGASRERADRLVALPIQTAVDSLNVAVAAGILLYELRP